MSSVLQNQYKKNININNIQPNNKLGFSLIELSIILIVIGLLISAVISGNAVIKSFRFASAKNLTNNSPVKDIENLALWLETTQAKSFASTIDVKNPNNAQVALWKDINLNSSINVHENTGYKLPTLKADAINGLPALIFKNDGYYTSLIGDISSSNISSPYLTIFAVLKSVVAVWPGGFSINDSATNNTQYIYWLPFHTDGRGVLGGTIYNTQQFWDLTVPYWANNKNLINKSFYLTLRSDGATNKFSSRANGAFTSKDNDDNNTITSTSNFPQGINLNIGLVSGSGDLYAYLGELIIFSRSLSDNEILLVENYLRQKWLIK